MLVSTDLIRKVRMILQVGPRFEGGGSGIGQGRKGGGMLAVRRDGEARGKGERVGKEH